MAKQSKAVKIFKLINGISVWRRIGGRAELRYEQSSADASFDHCAHIAAYWCDKWMFAGQCVKSDEQALSALGIPMI